MTERPMAAITDSAGERVGSVSHRFQSSRWWLRTPWSRSTVKVDEGLDLALSWAHLRGIFEGDSIPSEFIPRLAQPNADSLFPFDELITPFAPSDVNEAEAASASGEVIKPVLMF